MRVRIRFTGAARPRSSPEPEPPAQPAVPPPAPSDDAPPPVLPAPAAPDRPDPAVNLELVLEQSETGIIDKLMLLAFGTSDPGCVRANNEDYFLVAPESGLYLVADGMGGAQAGEQASKLASETVKAIVNGRSEGVDVATLVSAFEQANQVVKAAAKADPNLDGMGTTMVAAVERGAELLIASVGDSRCYTFHQGTLRVITQDQTWVNEVGRRLGLDEESLKNHPMRHVLTMAIGVSEQLRVNTYALQPPPGTLVLLCSDGLHGVVPDGDIHGVLARPGTLEERCKSLIELARARGGPDNVTTVLLESRDAAATP